METFLCPILKNLLSGILISAADKSSEKICILYALDIVEELDHPSIIINN